MVALESKKWSDDGFMLKIDTMDLLAHWLWGVGRREGSECLQEMELQLSEKKTVNGADSGRR